MTIISAVVCNKQGDILIARQWSHITKHALEESIHNLPRLIDANQQHTFVEMEFMRYVFLPIDTTMYIVLITKKTSNIIQDQQTIRLLHKFVQDQCSSTGINEENILAHDFELLLAFDDIISNGMLESINLEEIQMSLKMESAEENLHLLLMKQKEAEQNEAAKRHQMEIKKIRTKGMSGNTNSISSQSYIISSNKRSSSSSYKDNLQFVSKDDILKNSKQKLVSVQKVDYDEGVQISNQKPYYEKVPNSSTISSAPKKGLILGKKAKESKETIKKREVINSMKSKTPTSDELQTQHSENLQKMNNPLQNTAVLIEIAERFTANLTRDGLVKSMEINGDVILQFNDASKTHVAIQFEYENNLKLSLMKPHINLNKQLWTEKKQIAMKNPDMAFPVGTRVSSVKYKYVARSNSSAELPFTLTCWFTDGIIALELEFNSMQSRIDELRDIKISFSYPKNEKPDVIEMENARYSLENRGFFVYEVPTLSDEITSSSIQIKFSNNLAEDNVFPMNVDFELPYTFYGIKPLAVADLSENNIQLKFDLSTKCSAENFVVE